MTFIIRDTGKEHAYGTCNDENMKALKKQPVALPYENLHRTHHDSTGIICLSQISGGRWSNRYYNYNSLCKVLEDLENLEDLFYSQNTFKKFRRSTEHLFELKACYIDLDYYKMNLTKEQTLFGIEHLVNEHSIPQPTMIIDSGHGIYLIWRIKRIPAMAVKLWRFMEEYLYWELKDLGADRTCLDPTRVFRVVDSLNCKYPKKERVQLISIYPIEYDLHALKDTYLTNKSKPRQSKRRGKLIRIRNVYTLYCNRKDDILSVCKMRNFNMTGMREIVLFLYRYYSCLQYTEDEAVDLVKELNASFTKPCKEKTVLKATRSAEKAAAEEKYNYRNATLIELLQITEDEMRQKWPDGSYVLKTIISKDEKYRRNNEKRNNKRKNSQGNTDKQQLVCDNLEIIRGLKERGYKQKEIASELNMSIRNIQKYYKLLREEEAHTKSP